MMNLPLFASVHHTQLLFAPSVLQKHAPAIGLQLPGKSAHAFGFLLYLIKDSKISVENNQENGVGTNT